MTKPILCVDFDGVLHSYDSGWKGADVITDPPVKGAIQWLQEATKWWNVQIYSSRSSQEGGTSAMYAWLLNHATHEFGSMEAAYRLLAEVSFPAQKPAAFLTIDDRAVCFHGDFDTLSPQELLKFEPWNKKAGSEQSR